MGNNKNAVQMGTWPNSHSKRDKTPSVDRTKRVVKPEDSKLNVISNQVINNNYTFINQAPVREQPEQFTPNQDDHDDI